jgi:hypothetical protein
MALNEQRCQAEYQRGSARKTKEDIALKSHPTLRLHEGIYNL